MDKFIPCGWTWISNVINRSNAVFLIQLLILFSRWSSERLPEFQTPCEGLYCLLPLQPKFCRRVRRRYCDKLPNRDRCLRLSNHRPYSNEKKTFENPLSIFRRDWSSLFSIQERICIAHVLYDDLHSWIHDPSPKARFSSAPILIRSAAAKDCW